MLDALRSVFGFPQFRGQQEAAIKCALEGTDCFVLMPTGIDLQSCSIIEGSGQKTHASDANCLSDPAWATSPSIGGGKSLCYSIPALVMGQLVLVVSPLIGEGCCWPAAQSLSEALSPLGFLSTPPSRVPSHPAAATPPPPAALMQDQVGGLRSKGVNAAYLSSCLTEAERRAVLESLGDAAEMPSLLFVTPELLMTR